MIVNPINDVKDMQQIYLGKNTGDFQKAIQDAVNEKDKNKLKEACKNLEAEFVKLMLDEMRKTIPKDPITGNDFATDVFTSMMYEKYAEAISQNSNLGLADTMYKQLSKNI